MKTNTKKVDSRLNKNVKLAGGGGLMAAVQNPEALLRRAVMSCLLFEDMYYETGADNALNIAALIPLVKPEVVAAMAIEARNQQKLRHVPLYMASEMAKHKTHRPFLYDVLTGIVQRPDELSEFLAIYWKSGKTPIAKQAQKGLANAFTKFNAYQLAKYNRDNEITLRDVMFLTHPKPINDEQAAIWKQLVDGTLPTPNTWEVRLSSGEDKKTVWEDLIQTNQLGAMAYLRNLRNMEEVKVDPAIIRKGFESLNSRWLLPVNYIAASKASPRYEPEIEALMLKGYSEYPKLPGYTVFVVDRSGSMGSGISGKSQLSRLDVAIAMAIMAQEVCERVSVYATAGNDGTGKHTTVLVPTRRGFGLADVIDSQAIGGGGIFTRQALEYIKSQETEKVDRIIVFSDSQDCDKVNKVPDPFGTTNYLVDVSAHAHGVNYKGIWTSEISGWSDHFLTYIAALEGTNWNQEVEDE